MVRVLSADRVQRGFKIGADLPPRPDSIPPMCPQTNPKNNYQGPVTFACVLRQSKLFGVPDVVRLRNGIRRNYALPHRFVCLTDVDAEFFPEGIEVFQLKHLDWITKQSKLEMFRLDLLNDWQRTFYMDLDTVICGDIGDLCKYDGDMIMLPDFSDPFHQVCGSGLMAWSPRIGASIYEAFRAMPAEIRNDVYRVGGGRSDQLFINHYTPIRPHWWSTCWPGQVVSYKIHCRYGYKPRNARIICFHGSSKPKNVKDKWILDHWNAD